MKVKAWVGSVLRRLRLHQAEPGKGISETATKTSAGDMLRDRLDDAERLLPKERKIALTLLPLQAAIRMRKEGRMDERTLMVMNVVTLDRLFEIDPEGAEAAIRKALGRLAADKLMKLRESGDHTNH